MLRVLVADDNPLSLRFFEEALQALGHRVVGVANGAAALAEAQRSAFDLVLLDARMPNLGGVETWQRIHGVPGPSRHACPLATTADDSADARQRLLDAGFIDVLIKPLTIADLHWTFARHAAIYSGRVAEENALLLDDRQALAAGGDTTVMIALRGLLVGELEALPAEMTRFTASRDADSLRERLHRLDASAGFCGAPALSRAAHTLRGALDGPHWPSRAIEDLLSICDQVRIALGR